MGDQRLDQLKFPDETKTGLALVIIYMLLDVTRSFAFGGWHVAGWLGLEQSTRVTGVVQVVMLAAIFMGYLLWRRKKVFRDLGAHELAGVDPALAEDADYLANHIARGRGRFLVTSNFDDSNAFCLASGRETWIVLGAGLRVLFRKQRERVRAILAHECSHIDSGDIGYVVIAWYLLCAYALLAFANLVVAQGGFWARVPAVLPMYEEAGGFFGLIQVNARYIFSSGFSGLVAIAGIWLLQRHFFLLREFRADERAAQAGFRGPLVEAMGGTPGAAPKRTWRRLLTMHPEAKDRIDRLVSEQAWARLDLMFLGGMAFLVARIENLLPPLENVVAPYNTAESFFDAMSKIEELASGDGWAWAGGLMLDMALAFVVALHVYRVATTQARTGANVFYRLSFLFPATFVVFVGAFLGEITSWGELARLTDTSIPWTLSNALDTSFLQGALLTMVYLFFAASIAIIGPRSLRRAPKSWTIQTVSLLAVTLVVTILLQVAFNVVAYGVAHLIGGLHPWEIEWLPLSSMQPWKGGPSAMQTLVLFVGISALLALPRWLGAVRLKEAAKTHEGWLAAG